MTLGANNTLRSLALIRYPLYVSWKYTTLSILGRIFTAAGIIVFLFVGYQLWGTNLAEARNQDQLQEEAKALFSEPGSNETTTTTAAPGSPTTKPGSTPTTAAPTGPPPPPTGSAVAIIKIPKIKLQKAVVEGTNVGDLKKGPGHYTGTPLPGQPGNAAIAGHRTTYGAPFGDLGLLKAGDEIDVTTRQGQFVYRVSNIKVVSPSDVSVIKNTSDNRLTLTTCHPKFSAAQRLIITAALAPGEKPAPASAPATTAAPTTATSALPGEATTTTAAPEQVEDITNDPLNGADLSGTESHKGPAILWGAISALVLCCTWGAGRLFSFWPSWMIGTPVFLVVLFIFFENFAVLLPANA